MILRYLNAETVRSEKPNLLDPSKIESDYTGNKLVYGAEATGMIIRDGSQFLVDRGII